MILYTNNELSEREIKKIIPFTIAPPPQKKKTRNITKDLKDLQAKNYKTMIKETEWTQDIPCLWVKIPLKYPF